MHLVINLNCTEEELESLIAKAVKVLKKKNEKKHYSFLKGGNGIKKYTIAIREQKGSADGK